MIFLVEILFWEAISEWPSNRWPLFPPPVASIGEKRTGNTRHSYWGEAKTLPSSAAMPNIPCAILRSVEKELTGGKERPDVMGQALRSKSRHWDYLLQEMMWMADDFREERKRHLVRSLRGSIDRGAARPKAEKESRCTMLEFLWAMTS